MSFSKGVSAPGVATPPQSMLSSEKSAVPTDVTTCLTGKALGLTHAPLR